jgi:hypothetical protein
MRISLALTLAAYIGALIITAPTSASSAPLALSDQLAGSLETSEVLIQKVRRWSRRGYYAPYYYPYYRPYYQPYYYYRPYYRPYYYPYYRPYYRPYPYYY